MKCFLTLLLFVFLTSVSYSQPDHIKRIIEKARSGKELTEEEEATMEKWMDDLDKQPEINNDAKPAPKPAVNSNVTANKSGDCMCPKKQTAKPPIAPLTRESYIALAHSLMAGYGPKTGTSLPQLIHMLESSPKPTDGADMGALFSIVGAGSSTIYATAWSAAKEPGDLLTANNLGVALKDMGEYNKALQVLLYADKLKPNIALVVCNLGWVYREMGDEANARIMFEKAIKLAPEMPSPNLGLGLLYECQGNHAQALIYLRKALSEKNSAVGIKAYRQAKAAQTKNESSGTIKPVATEQDGSSRPSIPELPVSLDKRQMQEAEASLNNYSNRLSSRIKTLTQQYQSTLNTVKQQSLRASKDPDNSIVFSRDFSKEIFMFQDVTELLWGQYSNWGKAVKEATKLSEKTSSTAADELPGVVQMNERNNALGLRRIELTQQYTAELEACGGSDACAKAAKARFEAAMQPIDAESKEIEYQACKRQKNIMEVSFANRYKAYKLLSDELANASVDYYAFTNPILAKIYSPSFNELLNISRELQVLIHQQQVLGMAIGLPQEAKAYAKLKCVEPEPPIPAKQATDPKLSKKKEEPCPLGEDGIKGGIGILSFELSCKHAKLSGGEGILWSVSRDFQKHETTFWGGVGVKGDYGKGNVSVEATVGMELTVAQGDVLKDVVLTSSVKAGLGGLAEGEISGRMAAEGGPAVEANAGFTMPELPQMPGD